MINATVPDNIDHQPFSIYYLTVSGHSVYSMNGSAMARKNYHLVEDLDVPETLKCYYAAQMELEFALESLVAQLEAAGIADDTVIVLATDHYPYGLERSGTWENSDDYLCDLFGVETYDKFMEPLNKSSSAECRIFYHIRAVQKVGNTYSISPLFELSAEAKSLGIRSCRFNQSFLIRDHSALIIWSGCIEEENLVVEEPVYSLDILPTLSNLFGLSYDSRLLPGRDVFSTEQPLVLWMDKSWKTEKGIYDAETGVFTPAQGEEQADQAYIDRINAMVSNKLTYCRWVMETDFFNTLYQVVYP